MFLIAGICIVLAALLSIVYGSVLPHMSIDFSGLFLAGMFFFALGCVVKGVKNIITLRNGDENTDEPV